MENRTKPLLVGTEKASAGAIYLPAIGLPREENKTKVRSFAEIIPSWTLFVTVILATLALCVGATVRTHAEQRSAFEHYQRMKSEVEFLRYQNLQIENEVNSLLHDPKMIEFAARSRLNMVRSNEIVVPVE